MQNWFWRNGELKIFLRGSKSYYYFFCGLKQKYFFGREAKYINYFRKGPKKFMGGPIFLLLLLFFFFCVDNSVLVHILIDLPCMSLSLHEIR